jgi:thiamine biosynthesis lipoprotein
MDNLRKKMEIRAFFFIICLFVILLSGCAGFRRAPASDLSESAFLLDTVVRVTYYDAADADAVREALDLCATEAKIFSRTDPESELYRLNEAGSLSVSDELLGVLRTALDFCAATDGAFDVTMGGVSALYGFSSDAPSVPDPAARAEALRHVGWEKVRIEGSTVTLEDPETVLDLGAVAKGYIGDRMAALLAARGVAHAVLDLGGNVLCLGGKPDGGDFRIGVRYPETGRSDPIAVVTLREGSVVTSGVYERGFIADGVAYHHILDPKTGDSVRNGLRAVTILGPESLRCDALSTAAFALGPEEGMALVARYPGYEALFITDDFALHPSPGFAEALSQP